MLVVRLQSLTTILCLLAFISFATAEPFCNAMTYGHPNRDDCRDLVVAIDEGPDRHIIADGRQRFFSLPKEKPPDWIPVFDKELRTGLPIFDRRGQSSLIIVTMNLLVPL